MKFANYCRLCSDQSGQPAAVRHHLRRQPGGGGQREHDERRGGLHGRRQDHRQRPDYVQVKQGQRSLDRTPAGFIVFISFKIPLCGISGVSQST